MTNDDRQIRCDDGHAGGYLEKCGDLCAGEAARTFDVGNATSYSVTTLSKGVKYHYRVISVIDAGMSPRSEEQIATSAGPD